MTMKKAGLPVIGIIILCLSGLWSASAEICNRVVAKVNNDLITLHELNSRMKNLTGVDPISLKNRDEKKYNETRKKILELLIEEKIAFEKIRELGIEVSSKEVDAAIERIKANNSLSHEDLLLSLKQQGTSYDVYREQIKNDLERAHLINLEVKSKIIIREEKIKAYYNAHRQAFKSVEKVHLATIFLKFEDPSDKIKLRSLYEKADQITEALKNGEDFGELAKQNSDWPGAEEGGDLGLFKMSQLDGELRKIIRNLSPGQVSDPILRPEGIQIIKLLERHGGKVKSLEEVHDAIFGLLFREEVNKRYASWIQELKEKSYTEIVCQ